MLRYQRMPIAAALTTGQILYQRQVAVIQLLNRLRKRRSGIVVAAARQPADPDDLTIRIFAADVIQQSRRILLNFRLGNRLAAVYIVGSDIDNHHVRRISRKIPHRIGIRAQPFIPDAFQNTRR